jgi:hypothetical protein
MAFTLDYATGRGKVRLLISDIDKDNPIFEDDAIDAFITIAQDGNVKRAASTALVVIATNEVLVQKRIKLLELQTDGPAEATALMKMAAVYKQEAEEEETIGAFDWAEMVLDTPTYTERVSKEILRES